MLIYNPFQINDWPIKRWLAFVSAIQLIILALVGIGSLGLDIPIFRPTVGFIYLTFVPGIVLLRILRLHNLGNLKTLLYTVGLSLTFDMLLGFLINALLPPIGIVRPLSLLPFIVAWLIVLAALCAVAYVRDNKYAAPPPFKINVLFSPPVLILIMLPLLAVLGTQIMTFYSSNVLLMLLMAFIGIIVLVLIFSNFISEPLYPLAIFCIALALVWHFSLTSAHLIGYDVFNEYYFFKLANIAELWNPMRPFPHIYNEMLSVTVLPVIFSHILAISGEQIFKVIYPLWYALVPLGLYCVYQTQLNNKYALLGVFYVISMYTFFLEIPSVNKEILGELFFTLLLILLTDGRDTIGNRLLIIVFSLGLVVSHYSLSFLYLGFLLIGLLAIPIVRAKSLRITIYSVALFTVMCLAWYMYMSGTQTFKTVVYIWHDTIQNFNLEFLNPLSRDVSLYVMQTSPTILHLIARILNYLMLLFVAAGAIALFQQLRKKEHLEYAVLSLGSYLLLAAALIVPFLSDRLGAERVLHISALVIAPYSVLGLEAIFKLSFRPFRHIAIKDFRVLTYAALTPLLVIIFWLNSGFIFELFHDSWLHSPPLSLSALDDPNRTVIPKRAVALKYLAPTEQEISSAEWLGSHMNEQQRVYATYSDIRVPSLVAYGLIPNERIDPIAPSNIDSIKDGYIYLGYVNNVYKYGSTNSYYVMGNKSERVLQVWDIALLDKVLDNACKVFDNGISTIYWLAK